MTGTPNQSGGGMTAQITVRCVGCRHTKAVGCEQRETPICDKCFMPMVAESASA